MDLNLESFNTPGHLFQHVLGRDLSVSGTAGRITHAYATQRHGNSARGGYRRHQVQPGVVLASDLNGKVDGRASRFRAVCPDNNR
jgi:hypothetical protein